MATKEQLLKEVRELKETSTKEAHSASDESAPKRVELDSVLEGVREHIATLRRLAEEP